MRHCVLQARSALLVDGSSHLHSLNDRRARMLLRICQGDELAGLRASSLCGHNIPSCAAVYGTPILPAAAGVVFSKRRKRFIQKEKTIEPQREMFSTLCFSR